MTSKHFVPVVFTNELLLFEERGADFIGFWEKKNKKRVKTQYLGLNDTPAVEWLPYISVAI